ncbi:MAG: hypothetical protein IT562_12935 [Alphaproteobacteria bacterium]|nr:hypothetical protein [Alphaproteobacteria bacterium]
MYARLRRVRKSLYALSAIAALSAAIPALAAADQLIPMHICSPDTHRAAFIVYSDGGVYYCANDACTAIEGAPRNSSAFPMVVGCEKEPFVYVAMSDGLVYRCSAGVSAPARCVQQKNLPLPAPMTAAAPATKTRRP